MRKKIFYIVFFGVLLLSFNFNVKSLTYGGCEYSQISRLKSYISNINISYDYYMVNNVPYFNVTINNMVPGIYFVDSVTDKKYEYSNSNNGEIIIRDYRNSKGSYKFYSALPNCYGIKLTNKYYSFPNYNKYYESEICKLNKNHSLCQKWVKITYSYDELETKINKYNEKKEETEMQEEPIVIYEKTMLDSFVEFYVKYYYIILLAIIIGCVAAMVINRRKNKFDI